VTRNAGDPRFAGMSLPFEAHPFKGFFNDFCGVHAFLFLIRLRSYGRRFYNPSSFTRGRP
jgi:hypothetical protein